MPFVEGKQIRLADEFHAVDRGHLREVQHCAHQLITQALASTVVVDDDVQDQCKLAPIGEDSGESDQSRVADEPDRCDATGQETFDIGLSPTPRPPLLSEQVEDVLQVFTLAPLPRGPLLGALFGAGASLSVLPAEPTAQGFQATPGHR